MQNLNNTQPHQEGQTLIETLVAAFILTMGISAALGLASYSLNATQSIRQQIIAMGLAREGLEVVKNMRDTNWLRGIRSDNNPACYNNTSCYLDWLNPAGSENYDLTSTNNDNDFYISLNACNTCDLAWDITRLTGQGQGRNRYGLNFSADSTGLTQGLYRATGTAVSASNSGYGRQIKFEKDTFAPFDATSPRLKVTSTVWWTGPKCPVSDIPPASTNCKIVLQTYLTNWKDY